MTYSIKHRSYKNFVVEKGHQILFDVQFPSIWCNKAVGTSKESNYTMVSDSLWGTRYNILKNGELIGTCKYDWKGHFNMDLRDEVGKTFQLRFKYKGFWTPKLAIYLNNNQHLFTMHGRYRNFAVEWEVEVHQQPTIDFPIEEIVGLLGYGARCYQATSGNY